MNRHIGNLERPGNGALPPDGDGPLRRLKKKEPRPYTSYLQAGTALGSGVLLGFAMPPLIGAESLVDYLKCGAITLSAAFGHYAVNRLALDKGAEQTAIGSLLSGVASIGSILVVGAGMFAATYAGLTVEKVEQLRLGEHAAAQAEWIDAETRAAREASRIAPAIRAAAVEIAATETCEREASCLSGFGGGGEGPVYRALGAERRRAEAMLGAVTDGEARLAGALADLAAHQAEFSRIVAGESLSRAERRDLAAAVAGRMNVAAGELAEASPVAMARGYALALSQGAALPERPEAAAKLDRLLAGHGAQIEAALAGVRDDHLAPPAFPAAAGVSDTLSYIPHFLPIALLIAAVEFILPLMIWLFAFVAVKARLEQQDDPEGPDGGAPSAPALAVHDGRRGRR